LLGLLSGTLQASTPEEASSPADTIVDITHFPWWQQVHDIEVHQEVLSQRIDNIWAEMGTQLQELKKIEHRVKEVEAEQRKIEAAFDDASDKLEVLLAHLNQNGLTNCPSSIHPSGVSSGASTKVFSSPEATVSHEGTQHRCAPALTAAVPVLMAGVAAVVSYLICRKRSGQHYLVTCFRLPRNKKLNERLLSS
jgi:hypothetical protein